MAKLKPPTSKVAPSIAITTCKMATIELAFEQQIEQANGYWLLSYRRQDDLPVNLPLRFAIHLKNAGEAPFNADLMQQSTRNLPPHTGRTGNSGKIEKNARAFSCQNDGKAVFLSPKPLKSPQNLTFALDLSESEQQNFQTLSEFPVLPCPCKPIAVQSPLKSAFWYGFTPFALLKRHFAQHYATNRPILLTAPAHATATALALLHPFKDDYQWLVILEHAPQSAFPFQPKPALLMWPELAESAPEAIGCLPLLEDWGIPNRLCSPTGQAGCFDGSLTDLLKTWTQPADWQTLAL